MDAVLQAFIFAFGAVIGSFVNAVLWRLRTGESFVTGRSYCPHCRHALSALDLIPALSYLLLKGKCRYCRKGIHPQYLIVELVMGVLFLLAARGQGFGFGGPLPFMRVLFAWAVIAVMVIVFVYDLRYMLILRKVTLPSTVLAVLAGLALGKGVWGLVAAMAVGAGFFYAQFLLSKGRWIGGGDIDLGLLMGAILGWPGIVVALMIAYVSGAFFGLALLATGRKTWQSQIPFGTFLSAATVVTLLWGDGIVRWYFGMLI
jgi:prepilin signal peptidase PulO-like enzyme (type II secretory pathway)